MGTCCSSDCGKNTFEGLDPQYKRILLLVITLNGLMFLLELASGLMAQSQALQADSLDFLGDTITYGLSFYVIGKSLQVRAWTAFAKGLSLLAMGAWVFGATLYRLFWLASPDAVIMGAIGVLALGANAASVLLLYRYKDGDANVRSVWLCSRNDMIGNLAVLGAASGVWASDTAWPDLIVAGLMAGLFTNSAIQILRQSRQELRSQGHGTAPQH